MTIEDLRQYILSKPQVTEDFPFDEEYLAFRLGGKIFAGMPLEKNGVVQLKCDPDEFDQVLESHPYAEQAWHWHKRHWIQINLNDSIPTQATHELVDRAYEIIKSKLTKKLKAELGL